MEGLINKNSLSGKTFSSSINGENLARNDCPISLTNSEDWCSGPVGEYESVHWGINFNKHVFLTNFSLQNTNRIFVKSFYVQGRLRNSKWRTISAVTDSTLGSYEFKTYPVNRSGPFSSVRFVSTRNGYFQSYSSYHFCIYKVEFFGKIFPNNYPTIIQKKFSFIKSFLLLIILIFL